MVQYDGNELRKVLGKARDVGTGQVTKSLIAVLRSLDSFYPGGRREFPKNFN